MSDLPEPFGWLPSRLPGLRFELHRADVLPPENTAGFICNGNANIPAIFSRGHWRNGKMIPLDMPVKHWGMLERRPEGQNDEVGKDR